MRKTTALVSSVTLAVLFAIAGGAAARADTASDSRATLVPGNSTTCSQVGAPAGDAFIGSESNSSSGDVSGVVKPNSGPIHPGQGSELDVTLSNNAATIDAVVVKGGNSANVYTNKQFLPPQLPPDQHYISPFTGNNQVPAVSHWFVCYKASGTSDLPVGAPGIFGLAAVAGIGLAVSTRRRRRPIGV